MDLAGFIPVTPKAGLPACWRWKIPDAAFFDRLKRTLTAESPRYAAGLDEQDWRWELMTAWQSGRCAICGKGRRELVRDHDHKTGLIRGLLCRGCNVREGAGYHREYGAIHPALICGVREMYTSNWASAVIVETPPQLYFEVAPLIGNDRSDARALAAAADMGAPPADMREYVRGRTGLLAKAAWIVLEEWPDQNNLERKVKAVQLLVDAGADESLIDGWAELKAQPVA